MQRRFTKLHKVRPEKVSTLTADHPAVRNGHTLFRKKVTGAGDPQRLLKSGFNNRKIGATVMKGPWAGMSIYTLTLEERATCPRYCAMWQDCYGNAMQWPERYQWGEKLEDRLPREIRQLARENPRGFVVRLHVLGDFYSEDYAALWVRLLMDTPELHIFGYTARSMERDPLITSIIAEMNALVPSRCAIRFSRSKPQRMGAIVVNAIEHEHRDNPHVFTCPAELERTACCATCALCWAPAMRDKAVAFILHGMVRRDK